MVYQEGQARINVLKTLIFAKFNIFEPNPSIMKPRILALIPLWLMLAAPVYSQQYTFRVLVNKGSNEYKTEGATWQTLKTGTSLNSSDELKLADNAYVGLVHADGKPIELKKAGSYKVSDLTSLVDGGATVLQKYVDFVLSSNSPEAKKNRLSATGAVHRAVESTGIRLTLPPNQNSGIFNSVAVINWDGTKVKGPYVITFRNMFDDVLHRVETPETSITLDLEDKRLATENAILIEVSAKDDPQLISEQHLIKKLAPAQHDAVKMQLNAILSEMREETALSKLILAGFYEEHELLIDAIASYEGAIKLAPDVPEFKDAYDEFLLRNALAY
jgi:hypothetical protein